MPASNVEKEFNLFGQRVVKQARTILSKKGINATKKLYNSLQYDVKIFKTNSLQFILSMEEYGKFINEGVRGVGGTKADGTRWKLKKNTGRYKYKDEMPPAKAFSRWLTIKGKNVRDAQGRFVSRKSAQFAVANAVYHQGIEQTDFLNRPIELALKKLPDDLLVAYGLDVDRILDIAVR